MLIWMAENKHKRVLLSVTFLSLPFLQLSSRWGLQEPTRAFCRNGVHPAASPWDKSLMPGMGRWKMRRWGARRSLSPAEDGAECASRPCQPLVPGSPGCHRDGGVGDAARCQGTVSRCCFICCPFVHCDLVGIKSRTAMVRNCLFLHLENRAQLVFWAWLMLMNPLSCTSAEQTAVSRSRSSLLGTGQGPQPGSPNRPGNGADRADLWSWLNFTRIKQPRGIRVFPRWWDLQDRLSAWYVNRACCGGLPHLHRGELRVKALHSSYLSAHAFLSCFLCGG